VEFYENFLAVSENILKEKVPGLSNYLADSEEEKKENAYDQLVN